MIRGRTVCANEVNRAAAREFRAAPIGQHSPALAHLLSRLRAGDVAEKYCLISIKPHSEWAIGVLSGTRGVAPRLADSQVFHSLEAAEWEVFKRRWAQVFGTALDEELP